MGCNVTIEIGWGKILILPLLSGSRGGDRILIWRGLPLVGDPMAKQMQMIMVMKNVLMLEAALMIAYFGTGPLSLEKDSR